MMMKISTDGWLEDARRAESTHCDARPGKAELLVVHGISLPPGEFGGDWVERLFCGKLDCDAHPAFDILRDLRVSAHFFIRRDGGVVQFVSCDMRAWHAGRSVWRGREDCNDFSLGVELEGADNVEYTEAQYEALAELTLALAGRYRHLLVAGHEHIAPGRKTDPGPAFDWHKLFSKTGAQYDGRA